MSITCTCGATIPGPGRYLCGNCERALATNLGHVPDMIQELDVEVTRQGVKASNGDGGGDGRAAAFDVVASHLRDQLEATVADLERLATGRTNHGTPIGRRVNRARHHLPHAIRHASVTGYAYDLAEHLHAAHRRIDRTADIVIHGHCTECGHNLTGEKDRDTVRCRNCETVHDTADLVQERGERVMEGLSSKPMKIKDLHAALALMGHAVPTPTLYRWAAAGKLPDQGRRTYLVDDALDICETRALTTASRG